MKVYILEWFAIKRLDDFNYMLFSTKQALLDYCEKNEIVLDKINLKKVKDTFESYGYKYSEIKYQMVEDVIHE